MPWGIGDRSPVKKKRGQGGPYLTALKGVCSLRLFSWASTRRQVNARGLLREVQAAEEGLEAGVGAVSAFSRGRLERLALNF